MYIIGSLIKKIKQAIKAVKNWYSVNEVTNEQLRLDHDEMMAEYQQVCREEDERRAREEKELMADILEDQRLERQIREWEIEDQEWLALNYSRCKGCGEFRCECCCDLYDEQQPEITSLGLRGPEEEEIPVWLEQANTPCPGCGLLPEFCQCQYEE
jgi:hypothetical protein